MATIQLVHEKALRYPDATSLPPVPLSALEMLRGETFVTFRQLPRRADRRISSVTGCTRFPDFSGDLVLYGVEADSPLSPLLIWDAVHRLPVGRTVTFTERHPGQSYLERAYYAGFIELEHRTDTSVRFRKVRPLRAEACAGLDRWTFGIPTGPDDPAFLNACVARILELPVRCKEILLCGRPHPDFKYLEHVRVVGEDIQGSPVRISEKKNCLADEAAHPNICILHDRVFLPRDFCRALDRFGDGFPFVTLQSIYYDDRYNISPRRYSDVNMVSAPVGGVVAPARDLAFSHFSPSVFADLERGGFVYANPRRYSDLRSYATGSLCLAKRDVWRFCPQNPSLRWAEFEDVEHGLRAAQVGVPTRVNPYALTQSMTGRAILSYAGRVTVETLDGRTRSYGQPLSQHPFRRKPLLKVSTLEAQRRLALFVSKYVSTVGVECTFISSAASSVRSWLSAVALCLNLSRFRYSALDIARYVEDYEKLLVLDQVSWVRKEYLIEVLLRRRQLAMAHFHEFSPEFASMWALRPKGRWFFNSVDEYFPVRLALVLPGTLASALMLVLRNGQYLYLRGGYLAYVRAILASTPYLKYRR